MGKFLRQKSNFSTLAGLRRLRSLVSISPAVENNLGINLIADNGGHLVNHHYQHDKRSQTFNDNVGIIITGIAITIKTFILKDGPHLSVSVLVGGGVK